MIKVLIIVAITVLIQRVYTFADVERTDTAEALSVPMSQVARVYVIHNDNLSNDLEESIEYYLPAVMNYEPMNADHIKNTANTEAFENGGAVDFMTLWWDVFKCQPFDYIDAFIWLHIPYIVRDTYIDVPYVEISNAANSEYPVDRIDIIPDVTRVYEHNSTNYEGFKSIKALRLPFSLSIPFWLIVMSCLVALFCGDYKFFWTSLIAIFLMGHIF